MFFTIRLVFYRLSAPLTYYKTVNGVFRPITRLSLQYAHDCSGAVVSPFRVFFYFSSPQTIIVNVHKRIQETHQETR